MIPDGLHDVGECDHTGGLKVTVDNPHVVELVLHDGGDELGQSAVRIDDHRCERDVVCLLLEKLDGGQTEGRELGAIETAQVGGREVGLEATALTVDQSHTADALLHHVLQHVEHAVGALDADRLLETEAELLQGDLAHGLELAGADELSHQPGDIALAADADRGGIVTLGEQSAVHTGGEQLQGGGERGLGGQRHQRVLAALVDDLAHLHQGDGTAGDLEGAERVVLEVGKGGRHLVHVGHHVEHVNAADELVAALLVHDGHAEHLLLAERDHSLIDAVLRGQREHLLLALGLLQRDLVKKVIDRVLVVRRVHVVLEFALFFSHFEIW
mmetsp:Transcript_45783/g.115255  ORF Transcript_45783/g.115255 Transcript_45783/m.115255 type:complete len:329 (-) Transcript_45783:93-1079(-)